MHSKMHFSQYPSIQYAPEPPPSEVQGLRIISTGIFAHSVVKSFPEVADEHGVIKGIYVVAFKELGPKRAD